MNLTFDGRCNEFPGELDVEGHNISWSQLESYTQYHVCNHIMRVTKISSYTAGYVFPPLLFRILSDLIAKWRGHQLKGLVKARDIEIALFDEAKQK